MIIGCLLDVWAFIDQAPLERSVSVLRPPGWKCLSKVCSIFAHFSTASNVPHVSTTRLSGMVCPDPYPAACSPGQARRLRSRGCHPHDLSNSAEREATKRRDSHASWWPQRDPLVSSSPRWPKYPGTPFLGFRTDPGDKPESACNCT